MKRKSWILVLACVCLVGMSCQNNKKNTPEAVTEAFAKAFYTADFAHLYQYTTKKSQPVVQTIQNGMKGNEARLEEMKNSKVELVEVKVIEQTDSTALCGCEVKINEQPRSDRWDLVKEDNEWKVTLVVL